MPPLRCPLPAHVRAQPLDPLPASTEAKHGLMDKDYTSRSKTYERHRATILAATYKYHISLITGPSRTTSGLVSADPQHRKENVRP